MRAAQINKYGGPEVIEINTAVEKPAIKEGQVLVEVHASSINPFDGKVRGGMMQQMMPLQFPATLGGDIAGVITEVGEGVTEFVTGDKVYGQASVFGGGTGAFAEYAAANGEQIAKMPDNVSFIQAAALPLTGVSALQVLQNHMKLQSGQKILIHGGAGGIGSIAIQIAKHIGASVATTASASSTDYIKQLGADEVLDYKTQKFEELLHEYDAVFDTVGGETYEKSFQVLKKGGIIVSMLVSPNEELENKYGVTAILQQTKVMTDSLTALTKLIEQGVVKATVDKIFPLEQIGEAFTAQENGGIRGKIVIEIKK